MIRALSRPYLAITVPMSDHRSTRPLRHPADNRVTVPTKPRLQIGILDGGFVCKISAGQQFYPAKPPAHWLMVAEVSGDVLMVPLASSASGDPTRCRPIGCYIAAEHLAKSYREDR